MSNALPAQDHSMDEILASIRRIIETGDERLARNAKAIDIASLAASEPLASGPKAEIGVRGASTPAEQPIPEMTDESGEISHARQGAEALAAVGDAKDQEPAELPSVVAEASRVSANAPRSIRRPSPSEEMPEWPQAIAANDRYAEIATEMFVDEFDEAGFADELLNGAIAGDPEPEVDSTAEAGEFDLELDDHQSEVAAHATPFTGFAVADTSIDREPFDDGMRFAHALISRESGERVAASFSELAAAIRDDHLRDSDVIVREVMRPMLQEWLDENLPRLVEQLVREEIERIARGGAKS